MMRKNNLFLVLTSLLTVFFVVKNTINTYAVESTSEKTSQTKLSEEKKGLISQNCGSLRQSLKSVQRSDSRARTYFGAIYETVSSKYLTPLNLRLVKNNRSSVALIDLQTSLAEDRAAFSSDFINYSKSLEELISIDCNLEPETFYSKLLETRRLRALVSKDMNSINTALTASVKNVEKLKGDLKNNE